MQDIYSAVPVVSVSHHSSSSRSRRRKKSRTSTSRRSNKCRTIFFVTAAVILLATLTLVFRFHHDSLSLSSLPLLSSSQSPETAFTLPSSLRGRMLDLNMNHGDDSSKIDIQTIQDDEEEEENLPQQGIQVKQFSTTTTTTSSSSSSDSFGITTTRYTSTLSSSSSSTGSSSSLTSPSFSSFVQEMVTVQQKPKNQDVNQYHDQGTMTDHDDKDTDNFSIVKTSVIHTSNGSDGEIHKKQFYTNYDESLDNREMLGNLDLNNKFFGQLVDVTATEAVDEDGSNDKKDEEPNNTMQGNNVDESTYGYDDFVFAEKYDFHDERHENNSDNGVDTDALSSVESAIF